MIYSFQNSGFRDPETGVYNQTYFMEVFNREWHRHIREHQGLALLYLHPYIHEPNDQPKLLKDFIHQVQIGLLRTTDLLARLENEQFALGLFNIDDRGIKMVIDRIESNLREFNIQYTKDHALKIKYELAACSCIPNREAKIEHLFEEARELTETLQRNHQCTCDIKHLSS